MTSDNNDSSETPGNAAPDTPLTFWQMLQSTIAAAFGVQSSRNRERDFTRGKASHFIFMGIGFTVIFVIVMIGIVYLVLSIA